MFLKTIFPLPPRTSKSTCFSQLFKVHNQSAILSVTPGFSQTFGPTQKQHDRELTKLYDVNRKLKKYDDKLFFCDAIDISITNEQAKNVETDTKKQANSDLWFRMCSGRITSSKM